MYSKNLHIQVIWTSCFNTSSERNKQSKTVTLWKTFSAPQFSYAAPITLWEAREQDAAQLVTERMTDPATTLKINLLKDIGNTSFTSHEAVSWKNTLLLHIYTSHNNATAAKENLYPTKESFTVTEASESSSFWTTYLVFSGTAVAQLVEALRYKSEGRGFDSRWCHWNFSLT